MRLGQIILVMCIALGCSEKQMLRGYDINGPGPGIQLDKELNEISGLAWIADNTLACVQDEKANVYQVDLKSEKIIDKLDFGKNADFEGLAIDGEMIYALRSDGHLFIASKGNKSKEYKFKKKGAFDFEGLCLDKRKERLLVACKEHGDKDKRDHVFIYSFSLAELKYEKDPLFKIDKDDRLRNFKPSGIAIHPKSGEIFVLSSYSKQLMVLNMQGEIVQISELNPFIYHQPEGITFAPDGTMYISNEKHDTYPTIITIQAKK